MKTAPALEVLESRTLLSQEVTFTSTDVPKRYYSDNIAVSSYLNIPAGQDLQINDLNVQLNITQPWDIDLTITLVSPKGTQIVLWNGPSHYPNGCGSNFSGTTFDDEAAIPIGAGSPPYTGSYKPDRPLSAVDGSNASGRWQLRVQDFIWYGIDYLGGRLNSWSLTITETGAIPAAPAALTATASAGRVDLAWSASAGATSYQVERSADGQDGWAPIATTAGTGYGDTGLAASTTYYYRVRASNAAGDSPPSPIASATTPAAGVLFTDDFSGTAPGPAWSFVGGAWSQSGGVLSQAGVSAGDPKKALVTGVATPVAAEVTARVRVDSWAGGDAARAGVSLGDDAVGLGYNLVFHQDTGTVQFLHDYVAWGNRYSFAWQVGTWYWFTLRQEADGTLLGKVWADGQAEPAGWMFEQRGWAARAGSAGLNGGSHAGATASFDDVSVETGAIPTPATTATFLRQDATTQGTWMGTYGAQGYDVLGGPSSLPSYASITPSGQWNWTWAAATSDPRALQTTAGAPRVAAAWYGGSFTVDVNLSDGRAHDLGLYLVDWDSDARAEQVQLSDAATGAVLSTQTISAFTAGVYLDYKVSGHVVITFTRQAGANAVLSGLFLDPSQ